MDSIDETVELMARITRSSFQKMKMLAETQKKLRVFTPNTSGERSKVSKIWYSAVSIPLHLLKWLRSHRILPLHRWHRYRQRYHRQGTFHVDKSQEWSRTRPYRLLNRADALQHLTLILRSKKVIFFIFNPWFLPYPWYPVTISLCTLNYLIYNIHLNQIF